MQQAEMQQELQPVGKKTEGEGAMMKSGIRNWPKAERISDESKC